ncbi:RHS repeat-associated core domain-containing protein [Chryseobacterium indologenes]|uniref:DUF6443 domain-containing protein n=1 Tax=Chryseobacterium indologenes TaxID=253 RepID=UPI000F4FEE54|nr:DUF6443 domain-containing protein [Chryseobacterium indologenes]AYZ36524.1 RHS repeat-associated core domain-containing protein [Chryseobacterium indologenes]MBF6645209.1 RHS repeat-associated core domain-containing protein [Chryseobacterium indologenes]MBU3049029.1 RHS repeat-associated core domain-containing protein [Chryseobacterium indologenes]MEB4759485.1 DUF6443 domain-containing protein [Chryseobacterium indologenes]QQQ71119.1 RHS repeat-associated core domain-containing protein [Chr
MKKIHTIIFLFLGLLYDGQLVLNSPPAPNTVVTDPNSIRLLPGFSLSSSSGTFHAYLGGNPTSPVFNGQNSDLSGVNENYVYARTYLEPKTSSDPTAKQIQSISFFDGLGKPRQEIVIHGSPAGNDLVAHIPYDQFGRQVEDWLPVPMTSLNGNIQAPPTTSGYYKTSSGSVDGLIHGKKNLENSPLDRLLSYTGPGSDWQGKKVTYDYSINSKLEVYKYTTSSTWNNGASSSVLNPQADFYTAGSLYKTVVSDEDGHKVIEYKNQKGQRLLVRKNDGINNLDTYYVYNEYNQLAFIIPPLAASKVLSPAILDELAYQYRYDGWSRLVEAKLPGKGWECMVYDKADRLVATQDANLREKGQWLFTKYDQFGRVAYTGINTGGTRAQEQTEANTFGSNSVDRGNVVFFNRQGMDVYYGSSDLTYPKSPTWVTMLSLNYYDTYPGYSFNPSFPSSIQGETTLTETPSSEGVSTKGLALVNLVKNIEDDSWTKNYIYYDTKERAIGAHSINHLGGYTQKESRLSFSGAPLSTLTRHKREANSTEITIGEAFTYDHQQRLIKHTHRINGGVEETLAEYVYNELGQLQNKNVGNGIQLLSYRYNTRGALTHINDPQNLGNKLFALELKYTNPQSATGLYNGNIAEVDWATQSDNILKRYVNMYDSLNRLTGGYYQEPNSSILWTGTFNEYYKYDLNSNITKLTRLGRPPVSQTTPLMIDDLSYTYQGNKLQSVSDLSQNSSGYPIGGKTIAYDDNGNMVNHLDKGISSVKYNFLDLPNEVVANQMLVAPYSLSYTYRADGTKVGKKEKKRVMNVVGNFETVEIATDYLDGFQYSPTLSFGNPSAIKLQLVPTSEGYYDFDKSRYIYNYTDHLGNIRVSFAKNSAGALEIVNSNDYYPYGMSHLRMGSFYTAEGSYKYKFLGNEQQETGWYDMNARFYMPDLGRFGQHDPLSALSLDAYGYAFNNPISFRDPTGLFGEGPKCPPDCSISPNSPGGSNNPISTGEVIIPAPGNPGGGYNGPDGNYNYPMGGYGYGDYSGGSNSIGSVQPTFTYRGPENGQGGGLYMMSGDMFGFSDLLGIVFSSMKSENREAALGLAALAIITTKGKAAPGIVKAEVGIVKAETRVALTDAELVTKAAQKAEAAIGGSDRFAGTAKHTYTKNLLGRYQSIYGDRGISVGSNYFKGPAGKGFLDVVNHNTKTIYDFKFGNATMSNSQFTKYSTSFPGYTIEIIRP